MESGLVSKMYTVQESKKTDFEWSASGGKITVFSLVTTQLVRFDENAVTLARYMQVGIGSGCLPDS